jgi:hypothetical protein
MHSRTIFVKTSGKEKLFLEDICVLYTETESVGNVEPQPMKKKSFSFVIVV